MEPELWQRITDLFDEAMTRGPEERIAFLERSLRRRQRLAQTGRAARQISRKIG